MPKKVRNHSWVAPIDPRSEFRTEQGSKTTGIYVHGSLDRVFLAHAGTDDGELFALPYDLDFLRDLGKAITAFADEWEKLQGGSN
ncbi:MAG TPA: hypothetical protein VND20_10280 [Candidatus Binataceae bacterium]|nr:hypothetical protein [Candidatus Binataceae bacterium]